MPNKKHSGLKHYYVRREMIIFLYAILGGDQAMLGIIQKYQAAHNLFIINRKLKVY